MNSEEIVTHNGSTNVNKFGAVPAQDFKALSEITTCPIAKLWAICWDADPFGNKFKPIKSIDIPERTFKKARKALKDAGLFDFVPKKNSRDSRKTDYWMVRNLHGVKSHLFGVVGEDEEKIEGTEGNLEGTYRHLEGTEVPCILPETHTQQASQEPLNKRIINNKIKEENREPLAALSEDEQLALLDEEFAPKTTGELLNILKDCASQISYGVNPAVQFRWQSVEKVAEALIAGKEDLRAKVEYIKERTRYNRPHSFKNHFLNECLYR